MKKGWDFELSGCVGDEGGSRSLAGKVKLNGGITFWCVLNAPVIAAVVQCVVLLVGVVGYGCYDGKKQEANLRYQRRMSASDRISAEMPPSLAALMEFKRNMIYVHSGEVKNITREEIANRYFNYRDKYNARPCDSVLLGVKFLVGDCLDYKAANGEKIGEIIGKIKHQISMIEGIEFEGDGESPFYMKMPDGRKEWLTTQKAMDEIAVRVDDVYDDMEKLTLLIQEAAIAGWSIWQ